MVDRQVLTYASHDRQVKPVACTCTRLWRRGWIQSVLDVLLRWDSADATLLMLGIALPIPLSRGLPRGDCFLGSGGGMSLERREGGVISPG